MSNTRPKWLFPECWEDGDVSEITTELQDTGVFFSEGSLMWTWLTRWREEWEIDCSHCGAIDDHYGIEGNCVGGMLDMPWRFKCKKCSKKFSVTSGTWLSNHKIGMEYWWRIAWLLGDLNIEVNSCWLARDLQLTQKTTHLMLIIISRSLGIKQSSPVKTDKDMHQIMTALLTVRIR